MERLYIRFKGRVLGPIELDKAIELVRRGQITRQNEVSVNGRNWQAAGSMHELFPNRSDREVISSPEASARSADTTTTLWYANFDGSNQGPTNEDGIKQWIGMAKISRNTLVWREGMTNWAEAGVVQPLWFAALTQHQSFDLTQGNQQPNPVYSGVPSNSPNVYAQVSNERLQSNSQSAGDVVTSNSHASSITLNPGINICILISGIGNILFGVFWISTLCGVVIGVPQIVLAIFELIYFSQADRKPLKAAVSQAKMLGALEIVSGLFNLISFVCGIMVVVFACNQPTRKDL